MLCWLVATVSDEHSSSSVCSSPWRTKNLAWISALLLCQPASYPLFETRFEILGAVPLLRQLVAGLPPQRSGFNPRCLCRGYMVDKVALGHFLLHVPQLSLSPSQWCTMFVHFSRTGAEPYVVCSVSTWYGFSISVVVDGVSAWM